MASMHRRVAFAALLGIVAIVAAALWRMHPVDTRTQSSPLAEPVERSAPPGVSAATAGPRFARLAGQVRSRAGAEVAGARVCAERTAAEPAAARPVCVDSDAKGRYAFTDVAPGGYSITAEAEGYFPGIASAGELVVVSAGDEREGLDIVLEPGGAKLAGKVLDATGGVVPGAVVRAMQAAPPHRNVAVVTTSSGDFTLWVVPGSIVLAAEAAGYTQAVRSVVAPSSSVVITLTPGSNVQGVVVAAADGAPVAGVEVHAVPVGSWASAQHPSSASDSNGNFAIHGLEPGAYRLVAEGDGLRGELKRPVEVGLAETVDHVTVTVSPAMRVSGKVVQRALGKPCTQGSVALGPTAPVQVSPYDPPSAEPETGISNVPSMMANIEPTGEVTFRSVQPGVYHATVQCIDNILLSGPTKIEVGRANVDGVVWQVGPGLSLVIHVVDDLDHALPGAKFFVYWPPRKGAPRAAMPFVADARGDAIAPGVLYPGTYTLAPMDGQDGSPVDVELSDGMGKVEAKLRLSGSGSVLATVRASDGENVDDVKVTATEIADPDAGAAPVRRVPGVALGDGRFRIGPLVQGRYRVEVEDGINPPTQGGATGPISVGSAKTVETTLVLERTESLHGSVVDSAHQPVPDVWVSAVCESDPPQPGASGDAVPVLRTRKRVVSNPAGRFSIRGIQSRTRCAVRAEQPYGAVGTTNDTRPGDDIVVTLPKLATLGGSASDASGRAVESLTLSLRDEETGQTRTETIASPGGRWKLERVNPGQVHILAIDDKGNRAELSLALTAGQVADGLVLQLRDSGATSAHL